MYLRKKYRKSEIQDGPKVGIQYIVYTCIIIPTFGPPCMCPRTSCIFFTVIYKTFLCPFYFEDVINSLSCIVWNGRVTGKQLIGNYLEGSDRVLI
jgi:hypothetical protein